MSEWGEEEEWPEDEFDEDGCDYGVSEYCSEPQTKAMGLCTTECADYLRCVEEEDKRHHGKESKE